MECETCREALSARLDGEPEAVPPGTVDAHLAGCAGCRAWQAKAGNLTRAIRVRPATPTPDLVAAVIPVRSRWGAPRVALLVVAFVQLAIAMTQLLTGGAAGHAGHGGLGGTGELAAHLFNEGTAWNLALGLGLLVAAVSPVRAGGLLPTLAGFVAVLAVLSTVDLISGAAEVSRVLSHAPLVAGLALLLLVHRRHRGQPMPGAPAHAEDETRAGAGGGETHRAPGWRRPGRTRPAFPAGTNRRHAA